MITKENEVDKDIDNETAVEKKENKNPNKSRKLGDEWASWDGHSGWESVDAPKSIFLSFAFSVLILVNVFAMGLYYLIYPRLLEISQYLPAIVLIAYGIISLYLSFWFVVLLITSYTDAKLQFLGRGNKVLLGFLLDQVFKLGDFVKFNKDKLGNSFVKVSNSFVKKTKKNSEKEKVLLLLPRCLTKESYQTIKEISKEYGIEMAVCTGGEIARKKVKEYRPSAVIGVACERDLVSGIKDVGGKLSVLGIPNVRPDGPCKNTFIDFDELRNSIEFYLSNNKVESK